MIRPFALIVAVVALHACDSHLGLARPVTQFCATDAANDIFAGVLAGNNEMGLATTAEFSRLLPRMQEPNLTCGTEIDEGYRLSVVRSLRQEKLAVRVWRQRHRYSVTSVTVDDQQPDAPPAVRVESIAKSQFDALRDAINTYQFWEQRPWQVPPPGGYPIKFDYGASWVLEGRLNGWYHAVIRGPDEKDATFDTVVRTLFELGKVQPQIMANGK